MAITHQQIDKIDPIIKATVYGYIHEFERENESIDTIPDLIIFTCLQFYCILELFDSFNALGVSVTNKGHTATKIKKSDATIYGRYIVTVPTQYIYHWKFKAIQIKSTLTWVIGIFSAKHTNHDTHFLFKNGTYAFLANGMISYEHVM